MLGEPVALIAPFLGGLGELDRIAEGLAGAGAFGDGGLVEYVKAERHGVQTTSVAPGGCYNLEMTQRGNYLPE